MGAVYCNFARPGSRQRDHGSMRPLLYRPLTRLSHVLRRPLNMAWRCSGESNQELVDNLYDAGLIKSPIVKDAFLKVDRADYAPHNPYKDCPQSIGHSATISAPHMHASAIEYCLAELVGDKGTVVGLEHIRELRDLGERNAQKSARGRQLLEAGRIKFRHGDGRKGWVEDGKSDWDVIHVGASAKILHEELLEQLKAPGCMFIPVDDEHGIDQSVWRIEKDAKGEITRQRLFGVRYVPLTDPPRGS